MISCEGTLYEEVAPFVSAHAAQRDDDARYTLGLLSWSGNICEGKERARITEDDFGRRNDRR
jgi:Cdc6-like AAA superfamily ATPase